MQSKNNNAKNENNEPLTPTKFPSAPPPPPLPLFPIASTSNDLGANANLLDSSSTPTKKLSHLAEIESKGKNGGFSLRTPVKREKTLDKSPPPKSVKQMLASLGQTSSTPKTPGAQTPSKACKSEVDCVDLEVFKKELIEQYSSIDDVSTLKAKKIQLSNIKDGALTNLTSLTKRKECLEELNKKYSSSKDDIEKILKEIQNLSNNKQEKNVDIYKTIAHKLEGAIKKGEKLTITDFLKSYISDTTASKEKISESIKNLAERVAILQSHITSLSRPIHVIENNNNSSSSTAINNTKLLEEIEKQKQIISNLKAELAELKKDPTSPRALKKDYEKAIKETSQLKVALENEKVFKFTLQNEPKNDNKENHQDLALIKKIEILEKELHNLRKKPNSPEKKITSLEVNIQQLQAKLKAQEEHTQKIAAENIRLKEEGHSNSFNSNVHNNSSAMQYPLTNSIQEPPKQARLPQYNNQNTIKAPPQSQNNDLYKTIKEPVLKGTYTLCYTILYATSALATIGVCLKVGGPYLTAALVANWAVFKSYEAVKSYANRVDDSRAENTFGNY